MVFPRSSSRLKYLPPPPPSLPPFRLKYQPQSFLSPPLCLFIQSVITRNTTLVTFSHSHTLHNIMHYYYIHNSTHFAFYFLIFLLLPLCFFVFDSVCNNIDLSFSIIYLQFSIVLVFTVQPQFFFFLFRLPPFLPTFLPLLSSNFKAVTILLHHFGFFLWDPTPIFRFIFSFCFFFFFFFFFLLRLVPFF